MIMLQNILFVGVSDGPVSDVLVQAFTSLAVMTHIFPSAEIRFYLYSFNFNSTAQWKAVSWFLIEVQCLQSCYLLTYSGSQPNCHSRALDIKIYMLDSKGKHRGFCQLSIFVESIDPQNRAIWVILGSRCALCYQPDEEAGERIKRNGKKNLLPSVMENFHGKYFF